MGLVNPKKQQGLAMVELAISLPFLILLLSIMGEMGYILQQQTALNKTLETGALYIGKQTRMGTGLVKIEAQTIQDVRNLIVYGNLAGSGDALVKNFQPEDISVSCTYGTENGFCKSEDGIVAITLQAEVDYIPVLGSLFHNVTGFTLFPLTLSATSTVVPI